MTSTGITEGEIRVNGFELSQQEMSFIGGYVCQKEYNFEDLTVYEHMKFMVRICDTTDGLNYLVSKEYPLKPTILAKPTIYRLMTLMEEKETLWISQIIDIIAIIIDNRQLSKLSITSWTYG